MEKEKFIGQLEDIIEKVKNNEVEPAFCTEIPKYDVGDKLYRTFSFTIVEDDKPKKDKDLEELVPRININLHDIFNESIIDNRPQTIESEYLKRYIGKTSTLIYLAIKHDLPIVVTSETYKRELLDRYSYLNVYSSRDRVVDLGVSNKGNLILVDEPKGYAPLENKVGVFKL